MNLTMYVLESHSLENVPLIYMREPIFKSRRKVIISGCSGLLELGEGAATKGLQQI